MSGPFGIEVILHKGHLKQTSFEGRDLILVILNSPLLIQLEPTSQHYLNFELHSIEAKQKLRCIEEWLYFRKN